MPLYEIHVLFMIGSLEYEIVVALSLHCRVSNYYILCSTCWSL